MIYTEPPQNERMSQEGNKESIDSLGKKIARLRKEIELIFFENDIYSWPDSETDLLKWLSKPREIRKKDHEELLLKVEEIRFMKEQIEDQLKD